MQQTSPLPTQPSYYTTVNANGSNFPSFYSQLPAPAPGAPPPAHAPLTPVQAGGGSGPWGSGSSAQQQAAPASSDAMMKTDRLMEMGFSRQAAEHALSANGGNEEAALNSLLA